MKIRVLIAVSLALVLLPRPTRSETGTTNLIEAGYINWGGQFVLGEGGPFNMLLIRNEGWLENTAGVIGYDPPASSNVAWVTGTNSLWDNRGSLRIGVLGRDNQLIITNGARVNAMAGMLGDNETSGGNSVLVTGRGSRWSSTAMQVGFNGFSNQFTIAQGGLATSGGPYDAVGYNEPSYGNRMLVDGAGSSFGGYNLAIGSFGSYGNELRIINGGQVATANGFVGNGSNNNVLISGTGSTWYNSAVFFHGYDGMGNRLLITNGGRIFSEGALISGDSNVVAIVGTNSLWETGGSTGQFDMGNPGFGNQMTVANGARLNSWDGYVVGDFSVMYLSGPGSLWQNTQKLTIGEDFGVGNQIVLSNQARLTAAQVTLAGDLGSFNLSGTNTAVTISDLLSIGDELGHGNQLTITGGAQLDNARGYLGGTDSAFMFGGNTANHALITGPGSAWINRSNLIVGVTGSETELAIRNRGRVSNRTSYLGYYGYSPNNRVVVSDPGSLWDNLDEIYVGYASSGNRLFVTNQARMQSRNAWVGRPFNETNAVLISDTNSTWNINGGLFVGNGSSGNRVTILNGGWLTCTTAAIDSPNGRSNSVVVTGPGAVWTVTNGLVIGAVSSLNHLLIEDGGTVIASAINIGNSASSISNTVTIDGGRLVVTNNAGSASLTLSEGALFLTDADLMGDRLQTSAGVQSLLSFGSGVATLRTLALSAATALRVGDGQRMARLQLANSSHTFGTGLSVASNSVLSLAGTALGGITNAGLLEIGTTIGGLTLTGSLVQARSGAMTFDLGGTTQRTGYDFIQIDGAVQFDGLLRLRLANGFVPSSNAVFTLISARTSSGTFLNVPNGGRLTIEGTGISCRVEYTGGILRLLSFQNAGPAGTNDIDDAWAIRYFGHSPLTEEEKQADPDGDGATNSEEYFAGTDPLDGQSALRIISIHRNGLGHAIINFSSVTNRTYGIAYSSDLENWQEVTSATFTSPSANLLQWVDDGLQTSGLGGTRFYQILVR